MSAAGTTASFPTPRPRSGEATLRSPFGRALLFWTYALGAAVYLTWRATATLNPEQPVWSALFFGAEVGAVLVSLAFYALIFRQPPRVACPPARAGVSVDVLITTLDEPLELLRTTAVAARDMTYPHRTYLCDDGHRSEVAALAAELGVGYLARGANQDFKAGNLNHALAHTAGELLLVLDADHVVRRQLLERLVGHFENPRVALVQLPQVYYNLDSFQHDVQPGAGRLWHEASLFHHVIQRGAGARNAAFFVGTGAVIRRTALEAIGGFATGTVTEDIHTSVRLHAAGFETVYVDEALGWLLAPQTPLAYARQRLRWARGGLQVAVRERLPWRPGLSAWQRLGYANAVAPYLIVFAHLVFYVAPALYLAFGVSPLVVTPDLGLWLFAGWIVFGLAVCSLLGAPWVRLLQSEGYKLLNLGVFVRAAVGSLVPRRPRFEVTPKGQHRGLALWGLVPVMVQVVANAAAIAAGSAAYDRGERAWGAVALTTFFAGLFVWSGAAIVWRAVRHRRSGARYAVPVRLDATLLPRDGGPPLPARLRRLARGRAYLDPTVLIPAGTRWLLELAPLGLGRAQPVVVESSAPVRARRWGRGLIPLRFTELSPEEGDLVDRYLFGTALPDYLRRFAEAPPAPEPDPPASEVGRPAAREDARHRPADRRPRAVDEPPPTRVLRVPQAGRSAASGPEPVRTPRPAGPRPPPAEPALTRLLDVSLETPRRPSVSPSGIFKRVATRPSAPEEPPAAPPRKELDALLRGYLESFDDGRSDPSGAARSSTESASDPGERRDR